MSRLYFLLYRIFSRGVTHLWASASKLSPVRRAVGMNTTTQEQFLGLVENWHGTACILTAALSFASKTRCSHPKCPKSLLWANPCILRTASPCESAWVKAVPGSTLPIQQYSDLHLGPVSFTSRDVASLLHRQMTDTCSQLKPSEFQGQNNKLWQPFSSCWIIPVLAFVSWHWTDQKTGVKNSTVQCCQLPC